MKFNAKARFVRISPTKLRLLANNVRGKDVDFALGWLTTCGMQRAIPIKKLILSASANAKQLQDVDKGNLFVKEIKVDTGPTFKYFKPGAMGKSNVYRKRLSHISVVLEYKNAELAAQEV